jgi:serine-type D-Ala-D-Ala carboxypeptidase/endopeptidase (penicillin-binding protein 4)
MGGGRRRDMGRAAHLRRRTGPLVAALAALATAFAGTGAAPARTQAERPLAARLARALALPQLSRDLTGALAVDLRTGRVVFGLNERRSLAPASTEKLAVAFAALSVLGPDYRIETDVLGEGAMSGSTWHGNLVLKGGGDPTLTRAGLRALAQSVLRLGIRSVTGGVVGDESSFDSRRTGHGWKPHYLIRESPALSALVVDRGRYRGAASTNPPLTAAVVFREELVKAGISVTGRATARRSSAADFPLAFKHSARIDVLVRSMGLDSDNFTAEMLLKLLGAHQTGVGTSAAGAAVVTGVLRDAGVHMGGVRVVDGSGLSLLNRATAASLVGLLRAAWLNANLRTTFLRSLPIAGVNGTMSRRLRTGPARGRVLAKTGTTRIASTLAGFVGSRYAFAVLHNGRPVATWRARWAQDRFVTVLASN